MARTSKVAIRRTYNDMDRWRAYNHFITTGWYQKTTAKACFIGISTLRYWVKQWDFDKTREEWDRDQSQDPPQSRNPPGTPDHEDLEEMTDAGDVLDTYDRLLRLSLARLEEVIPKTNSADQLTRVAKDMSERIDRAKGITGGQVPSTVNVNLALASAKIAGAELIGLIGKTIADANEREQNIIDVEAEPPRQIAASPTTDGSTDDA